MSKEKTIAAIAAAGALGIGAWWFLFREDGDGVVIPETDRVLDSKTSKDFTGNDKGAGVTADNTDPRGVEVRRGAQYYRWGNKVTAINQPPIYGIQSYRRTRTVPTASIKVDADGEPWQVLGRARRVGPQGGRRWEWNQAAIQTGSGFENNGAAIIAPGWSCSSAFDAGANNDNCRQVKGFVRNQMGYKPMEAVYDELWASKGTAGVPFIEWNEADARGDDVDVTVFPGLDKRPRAYDKAGFVSEEGRLWIFGGASRNLNMITDEDPAVRYFYSVRGERGARTAVRVAPDNSVTYVPRDELRPVWVGNQTQDNPALTHREFLSFRVNEFEKKNDPWQHEPFKSIDLARAANQHTYGGQDYTLDYSIVRGGNPQFKRMIDRLKSDYGQYAGGAGRVMLYARNIYMLEGRAKNWPVVNYGLINPFRGNATDANALPVDFGAPVVINKWFDMLVENPGFRTR